MIIIIILKKTNQLTSTLIWLIYIIYIQLAARICRAFIYKKNIFSYSLQF